MTPTKILLWLATAMCALSAIGVQAQATSSSPSGEALLCRQARQPAARAHAPGQHLEPHLGMLADDELAENVLDLIAVRVLCTPVGTTASPVGGTMADFEGYGARRSRTKPFQGPFSERLVAVTTDLGALELRLHGPDRLLVATTTTPLLRGLSGSVTAAQYTCYRADRAPGVSAWKSARISLTGTFGVRTVDVERPRRICFPSVTGAGDLASVLDGDALVCCTARLARAQPRQPRFGRDLVTARNALDKAILELGNATELCVAARRSGPQPSPTPSGAPPIATPTASGSPGPPVSLRVVPASQSIGFGESARFTAEAVLIDGSIVDFTERVVWSSSTLVAEAPNEAGDRGRIETLDPGTTTISATDPQSGLTSTQFGHDAALTVRWTLESIALTPAAARRGTNEILRPRATGHFAGGIERVITQKLTYASSDTSVAVATNEADDRSQVIAGVEGTATISAADPLSGITSTASAADVVLSVLGPLEQLTTSPEETKRNVGGSAQFTATGHYHSGGARNLTQLVDWASSDPGVALATNPSGQRSRVDAVGRGVATISATDPVSGVASDCCSVIAVDSPTYIYIQPVVDAANYSLRRVPGSWRLRAVGVYPNSIYRYITEQVVWSSDNPAAVAAPNIPGERGRVDAVGPGTARVSATDPATGIHATITLRALDGLSRVYFGNDEPFTRTVTYLGGVAFLRPYGEFSDGVAPLGRDDYALVSSETSIVAVEFNLYAHAVAPGMATLDAVDRITGISSAQSGDGVLVIVRGALERIVLSPSTATLRVGDGHSFLASGVYEAGVVLPLTQWVEFSSSDPNVAVAPNDYPDRSRIEAVGSGTTMVSAFEPVSGKHSSDAIVTVIEPLVSITVTPAEITRSVGRSFSFTATGRDGDGRTINLTQLVDWTSSAPLVAGVPNPDGNRSRVDALAKGAATISAVDPQTGLSSDASGGSATLVVDSTILGLSVTPDTFTLAPGQEWSFATTGYLSTGETVNLTQEVEYHSSNPNVAIATNQDGNRSRIVAVAPGTVVISAFHAGAGVGSSASGGNAVLTVVAP